jgi:S-adenosylmethionine:tRNA ribosyltransferase-isomerase
VVSLSEFDFELPPDRIAQSPIRPRDAARLLCVRPAASGHRHGPADPGELAHPRGVFDGPDKLGHYGDGAASLNDLHVRDLPDLLRPGDVMVVNDTRVIPAQLTAWRGDARIGITLDQPRPDGAWHALARNARRLHPGDSLRFDGGGGLMAIVTARDPDGGVTLQFDQRDDAFAAALQQAGAPALPPYIHRPHGPEPADAADYQTVFAMRDGAVAAPTAGLHFTPGLLAALAARGIRLVTVTLHVGAGTFLPVRSDDISQHRMHAERGELSATAAAAINAAKTAGGRIVAVGTTSLRLLESAYAGSGTVEPFAGETSLFILPGYQFRVVDLLMTNFHLPRSTLFMLVCAFAGTETMRAAYAHAIASGYRFYSYGDASLLGRHDR